MSVRTIITKSKAGHYHITIKGHGVTVRHPDKHSSLLNARNAIPEAKAIWDRTFAKVAQA